jgi:hypothetical protein
MTVGPRILFDKSFIQSLNGQLIDEMTLYFTPTCPSTLISEIIADLKLPPRADGRIGEDVVRQLATKMLGAHGAQPAPLRSLVVNNLLGAEVPMHGHTVPVLEGSPGVYSEGSMLLVDQTVQQNMWARWARGDFNTDDEDAATAWRAAIEATDLTAEAERWKSFAQQIGQPKSLEAVVAAVDDVIHDATRMTQRNLIYMALTLVRADMRQKNAVANYFLDLPKGTVMAGYAPFAAQAVRLYMCFAVGLARGFIGPRPSNTIDLQYLLYAPFCRVFITMDRLHRMLWEAGAVTSEASFVWGERLRTDLKQRNDWRTALSFDDWAAHRRVHGQWPDPIDGSIVYELWERHVPEWPRGADANPNGAKTIDDLEPHIQDLIKRASEMRRNR